MSINTLTKVFKETSEYKELIKKISSNKRNVQVQIIDEAVPYIIASLREDIETPLLIICHSPEQSRRMQERITAWSDQTAITSRFSENDSLPFERMVSNLDVSRERLCVLDSILHSDNPPTIVASAAALSQTTLSKEIFQRSAQ